jgi:hypothetical protein
VAIKPAFECDRQSKCIIDANVEYMSVAYESYGVVVIVTEHVVYKTYSIPRVTIPKTAPATSNLKPAATPAALGDCVADAPPEAALPDPEAVEVAPPDALPVEDASPLALALELELAPPSVELLPPRPVSE